MSPIQKAALDTAAFLFLAYVALNALYYLDKYNGFPVYKWAITTGTP